MNTHAFVLTQFGTAEAAFQLQEIELPSLLADEVCIEVEAFGLNYADIMARQGLYREAPPLPCVLGYEVVGKICQIGSELPTHLIGQRVLGFTRFGGYAKHAITKGNALIKIDDLSAARALPMATQAVTAYYMAEILSPIRSSDVVLIHAAAGGVGTWLLQLAKQKGATVIAKIGSDQKAAYVKALGADFVVNYKTHSYAEEIQRFLKQRKLTVSYNPVAGKTIPTDKKLLGPNGRLVLFGASDLASRKGLLGKLRFLYDMGFQLPIGLMMQSKSLLGVNMLKIAESEPELIRTCMQAIFEQVQAGILTGTEAQLYAAANMAEAHETLQAGTTSGKLAIFWD
ncbi:MAG: hypothetical protein RLZZ301_1438 [Bacteroidota bacterium]|jgi:NADPH2:quinone reductase